MDKIEEEAQPIDCLKTCTKYQECYPFVNPILCTKFEPKPDEGRLVDFSLVVSGQGTDYERFRCVAKAQRDLTASIKEAECQARVERLVTGMKALFRYAYTDGDWKDGELENFLRQEADKHEGQ